MVLAIVLWEDGPMDNVLASVPARVVVTDDLHRSRLTVFFRLLLAIPHFIWLFLWTVAAIVAAILNWFATLVRGQPPQGLYGFLARFVRYATHVNAYLSLAANPYPAFNGDPGYPVDVELAPPARQNRLKVVFRIILAIPAIIVAEVFLGTGWNFVGGPSGRAYYQEGSKFSIAGGVVLGTVSFLAWFACLVRGRMPQGFRNVLAWGIGYLAQVAAYVLLLSERYPNLDAGATGVLGGQPPRPVRLRIEDDLRRSRVTVFFRLFLVVPHAVWLVLWGIAVVLAVIANWFATLALGRSPSALHRFISSYVRYQTHVYAFLGLVANPFPGFVGRPATYPIDLEIDPPERQHRLITLGRLPLAIPALLVDSAAASSLLFVTAFLGWFASLATGRMPTGFRNAGAWALRYGAQVNSYLYVLTDRYPYSGPESGEEPEAEAGTEPAPLAA
jgi:hypothetical protein